MNSVVTFRLVCRQCSINTVGLTRLLGWGLPELSRDLYLRPLDFSPTLVPPLCLFQVPFQAPGIETQPPGQPMPTPKGSL